MKPGTSASSIPTTAARSITQRAPRETSSSSRGRFLTCAGNTPICSRRAIMSRSKSRADTRNAASPSSANGRVCAWSSWRRASPRASAPRRWAKRGATPPSTGTARCAIFSRAVKWSRSAWRRFSRSFRSPRLPHLPCGPALRPELVEILRLLVGVHRLPEPFVLEGVELAVARQGDDRLLLEHDFRVVRQVIEHAVVAYHEAAVHVALLDPRLFIEGVDGALGVNGQPAEAPGGMHGGDGAYLPAFPVFVDGTLHVNIREAVSVRQEKRLSRGDISPDALDAGGGHRIKAGLGQGDVPVFLPVSAVVLDRRGAAKRKGHIARVPKVVAEVFLDEFPLVPEAEDEVLVPVVGVYLHDVPQDRVPADWHHRLGAEFRFLAQARAAPAA